MNITGPLSAHYVYHRQTEKAANATVCGELGVLVKMLRFACENGKLMRLQAAVSIAYAYGWRTQSEVMTLARRRVHLEAATLRLDHGTGYEG